MRAIYRIVRTWVASLIIAMFTVFLIKTFFGTTTTVKGTSMYPTYYPGDKIIVSTLKATFNKTPNRGDCITFEAPSIDKITDIDESNPVALYDNQDKSFFEKIMYYGLGLTKASYIKRVVGLPGEHVEIKNNKVYIDGKELEEDYVQSIVPTKAENGEKFCDVIVPEGCVYVLGDNRIASSDSRRYGCIPVDKIEGKVWFKWWVGKLS